MRTSHARRPHVVYRAYGRRGVLLYVGCTHNLKARFITHRSERSPWLRLTVDVTVQEFPDGPSGYAAEKQAVANEHPVFNIQGSGSTSPGSALISFRPHVVSDVA